ncbi:MAG: hypothetical protein FD137_59 [Spirochaetes bacterium]|nr:MAG: hypothetical protein FD137_59 [Spirochaetota bacterium]
MKTLKKLAILALVLAGTFGFLAGVSAQETEDLELEEFEEVDQAALIARLQIAFGVEAGVLEGYLAEGYSAGQLWLALEIAREGALTLEQALVVAGDDEGYSWGLLAQKLGIQPGSSEFHALKARWTERKGSTLGELKREGSGGQKPEFPGQGQEGRGAGRQDRPEKEPKGKSTRGVLAYGGPRN